MLAWPSYWLRPLLARHTRWGPRATPALQFGQPRVMALFLALTLFQHLIDGSHNRDLRALAIDLLAVMAEEYTTSQMSG